MHRAFRVNSSRSFVLGGLLMVVGVTGCGGHTPTPGSELKPGMTVEDTANQGVELPPSGKKK